MPSEPLDETTPAPAQVIYDRTTGRPLGRFRRFDVARNAYTECEGDEALALFVDDEGTLARVAAGDPSNLGALEVRLAPAAGLGTLRVSEKRAALVERPRLRLRAERDVLEGDGKDSVALYVELVDHRGKILRSDGQLDVHLTTSRGKLSNRGGDLTLAAGTGNLTLTSVRETVDRVRVRVRDPRGAAAGDEMVLRFE